MATVRHEPEHRRLTVEEAGVAGRLDYRRQDGRMILAHTEVPPAVGGRGLGSRLVQAAVDVAAAEGLTVVPVCSFAAHWLRTHPEAAAAVRVDWGPPRR